MAEYEYLDEIDTIIMSIFKESSTAGRTVSEMDSILTSDYGVDLGVKRVRHRLNSLAKYTYLTSVKETKGTGGYHRIYYLSGVSA